MTIDDIKLDEIYDVAIIRHGFTDYVRDYRFEIEANWIGDLAGRYVLTFTHCYELTYKTLVDDDSIKESWNDLFTNFETWKKHNEPEGFVWGTNWSLAYPGFDEIVDSEKAKNWSKRLSKEMKEVRLQANSFKINLIYETWNLKKINSDTSLISQVMIPLQ
jgi:hypothetical protein